VEEKNALDWINFREKAGYTRFMHLFHENILKQHGCITIKRALPCAIGAVVLCQGRIIAPLYLLTFMLFW
jgi:hypothetical protein